MSNYNVYATQGQGEILVFECDTLKEAEDVVEEHVGEASFRIQNNEQMMTKLNDTLIAKDFLGRGICVGDTVVFPHSGAGKLVCGEVISISTKQCRIRCIHGHGKAINFKSGASSTMAEIVQRNHKHCCVIVEDPSDQFAS